MLKATVMKVITDITSHTENRKLRIITLTLIRAIN